MVRTHNEFDGTAHGHLVAVGPLKGLSTSVTRSLKCPTVKATRPLG